MVEEEEEEEEEKSSEPLASRRGHPRERASSGPCGGFDCG